MKIIALILLIVGIGISGLGVYGYFFSADYELCQKYNSRAEEKLNEARAAQGTSREPELMEEARLEIDSAERACRSAKQTQNSAMLVFLGGFAAIGVSVLLLIISRNRRV